MQTAASQKPKLYTTKAEFWLWVNEAEMYQDMHEYSVKTESILNQDRMISYSPQTNMEKKLKPKKSQVNAHCCCNHNYRLFQAYRMQFRKEMFRV